MTNVILIPCCNIKKPYGETTYEADVSAPALLSPTSRQALLDARRDLSRLLGLAPGPDLGSKGGGSIRYMPAYQRYQGRLYEKAQLTHEDALGRSGARVLIVSALYGLVTALEPIRKYDLEMKCTLPNRRRVYTWWKQRQLGVLVLEAIEHFGEATVYDLLSGDYRKALEPWPPSSLSARRVTYDDRYRPLRSGSTHHRGTDVRRLLGSA